MKLNRVLRLGLFLSVILLLALTNTAFGGDVGDPEVPYYDPYDNNPPGPPPNYNLVDSSYFLGVPDLEPYENHSGGYYIYYDTTVGKWHVANFLFHTGSNLEQYHGSILAIMDQDPAPGVNVWAQGFELTGDLEQNDRWGWVRWPDSIAENLYEIWWDYTIDYLKPNDTGDFRDTLAITVAGCAIDFNLWSSAAGTGGEFTFSADDVHLGDDRTELSDVPGFTDTYAGVTDQYQVNNPQGDPNSSRFSARVLPGASYNANGLIPSTGSDYNERYSGSWAYEANGIQFATQFCPPNTWPIFEDDDHIVSALLCFGSTIYDTINVTDPDPDNTLTLTQLSGYGSFSSTPSNSPATGYYEFTPTSSGVFDAVFEVNDGNGGADTLTITFEITISSTPVVTITDSTVFACEPLEICLPVDIIDNDCDVTSVTTDFGSYTGTLANFDQIGRINQLGGSIIQIGGGAPGTVLYTASDFVPPVNSLSGVDVTLPNFVYATSVLDYGVFPTGIEPGNSADHLLNEPTDLTFTAPGPGGPDAGDGDGSVAFSTGDNCIVGFGQDITACHGSNTDFFVFTNTNGGGTATLTFRENGSVVHTITRTVPGGSAISGIGGITFDLPDGIIFNELKIECLSGTLEIDAFAARTAPSATTADICFYADTAGVYTITVTAEDACGNIGSGTAYVTVDLNEAPMADAGEDISRFMCDWEEICFDITFSDPDDNIAYTELYSGPGALVGNQICFTPIMAGVNTFVIHAVDECGLEVFDTVAVTISDNDPPVATDPQDVTMFMCEATELCHDFTAMDPNGGPLTWTHLAGVGTITTDGHFCFTPSVSGTYSAAVIITDSCGVSDTTSILYDLTINSAPVANDPTSPVPLFQCDPEEVCYQFQATDSEGGSLIWSQLTGDGSLTSAGLYCFTPTGSGSYSATVTVTDSCGLVDTTNLTYDVTLNDAPIIVFDNDTTLQLCAPQPICIDYTVSDPQGMSGLIELLVAGPSGATIDTATNQVCFTPTTDGCHDFVVQVTDPCSEFALDTVTVCVSFGEVAQIECPSDPINVSLCQVDNVCHDLNITPTSAIVYVSHGVYANGELCFLADTTGTYNITIVAVTECSSDTCQLTFNVEIGETAQIDCPDPTSKFICEAGSVCLPVGIFGSGVAVAVSPIGTYSSGSLCFIADTSGHYEILVVATTNCGIDSCLAIADVIINSPPVATDPSPVDTFMCATSEICYQFASTDPDGGSLTYARFSGVGTVSSDGRWCFPGTNGTHSVDVVVSDSCGAADTTTMTYNVTINSAPVVDLGDDKNTFICASGIVCQYYTVTDADDNLTSLELIWGVATLDTAQNKFCFNPPVSGIYEFVLKATDACGAENYDTLFVTIDINDVPIVDAGDDLTIFDCTLQEICWSANVSDPDGNLTSSELIEGPGIYDGSTICFTPIGTDTYEFILKGTDFCGAETVDTITVYFTLNSPPTANAGSDQILFLCTTSEICWPVSCSDVDDNLSGCALVAGPGSYNGSNICFTPSASGIYEFVMEASDACGSAHYDTVLIDVTINSAPICTVPNDTLIFQCTATQICLPAFGTDVDGNLAFGQIVSGPGTLVGSDWCYMPVSDQTVTVTLHCEDSCGVVCESQFTVQIDINGTPDIAFGNDTLISLCTSDEICLPYIATDPDDPRPTTVTLVSGPGMLDEGNSQVCFTPSASGSNTFIIRIEDECGQFDQDTINVDVTVNSTPVADVGPDQTLFLCGSDETLCWPASCTDVDDNLTDCVFNGPGLYDGSSICFNPTASGTYTFTLSALDECGETHADTVTINVTLNSDPVIALGSDTSLSLCTAQEVCLGYTVSDPDGPDGLTVSMVSGYGSLDTVNNEVCFTPTADGSYEFILSVTDSCGALDLDTIVVDVTLGETTWIDCPTSPFDVSLCEIDTVCQALTITPATATVTVSYGTYANGELCFPADTSGAYIITVIVSEACGADTCEVTFYVEIGEAAYIDCPDPTTEFICTTGNVCVDVGIYGSGAVVDVSPIGTYGSGQLCFPADTVGHYEIMVVATTDCGTDSCLVVVDVTINEPPVGDDPSPVDTFICVPATFCYLFTAQDDDNDALTFSRLSGDGTVNANGEWCFDVTVSGTYTVCAVVSDGCGTADTVCHTYNVIINTTPDIAFNRNTNISLCTGETICTEYTVTDPDDNGVVEQLLSAFGTIDTVANEICLVADTSGNYTFIVGATDGCGASDADTITITVQINSPPVADAGDDQTIFQCNQTEICWPASCSDPDDNLDSCYLTEGVGIYAAGQICFTPDGSGDYTFVLRSVDVCGAFDQDTVNINVTINSAPVCDVAGDTAYFQCSPTHVSRRVTGTDIDGNFDHCEIITGPGSIIESFWVYKPTADQSVTVQIMCLDDCGSYCEESFTVDFNINTPPVVDAGEDKNWFMCAPMDSCWSVTASDEDGNLSTVELIDGPAGANYNAGTGDICFSVPAGNASYTFVVKATDVCGAVSFDTTRVTVRYNSPPTLDVINNMTVYLEEMGEVCYPVAIDDVDGNLSNVYTSLGTYDPGTEQICFIADSSGTYCMIVTATDTCQESVTDSVCVTVVIDECIHVRIEKTHNAIQGQIETVGVYLYGSAKELGGYDILVAYDQSALSVQSVEPGVLHNDCGWEYFNFRYGDDGNCGTGCPSGLLRIIALAETNNGANHPGCFLENMVGTLADINFMVSDDRTLECQFAPVSFFWMDCGDNGFSGKYGDTLWISRNVYNFEHQNITDVNYGFPGYFGAPDQCLIGGDPDKPTPLRCVDFTNGGVDIVCADSIDARADINLNGVAYEVADAVVFSNYFVYGLSVFNVNVDGQIAATDVNADGISLSVADLVYLIRVIVGDTPPMPKIAPGQTPQAQLGVKGGVLSVIESDYRIGAISVIFEGEVEPKLHENAQSMEIRYNYDGEHTRVLIYNMDGQSFLETGPVLHIDGNVNVVSFDVGSYDGFTLAGKIKELPEDFHLAQNYPNPFNPSTTFEFALPLAAEWKLVVYNVLGQTVRTWHGENDAGYVRVDWDASSYASGVYFYRLQADNFSSTKKMVLLK